VIGLFYKAKTMLQVVLQLPYSTV